MFTSPEKNFGCGNKWYENERWKKEILRKKRIIKIYNLTDKIWLFLENESKLFIQQENCLADTMKHFISATFKVITESKILTIPPTK